MIIKCSIWRVITCHDTSVERQHECLKRHNLLAKRRPVFRLDLVHFKYISRTTKTSRHLHWFEHTNIFNTTLKESVADYDHPSPLIPTGWRKTCIAPDWVTAKLRACDCKNMIQDCSPHPPTLILRVTRELAKAGRYRDRVHLTGDFTGKIDGKWLLEYGNDGNRDVAIRGQECAIMISWFVVWNEDVRHRVVWPEHGMTERDCLISRDRTDVYVPCYIWMKSVRWADSVL